MNRSAPSSPGHFIPPVPPIPAGHAGNTPTIRYPQSPDHGTFFSADDILRASFITTGTNDPRASVATTIYRNNAVVSPVAANVARVHKAAVVNVKTGSSTASTPHLGFDEEPPMPTNVDLSKYQTSKNGPSSPAFSVGSTFMNKVNESSSSKAGSSLAVPPRRPVLGRTVTAEAVVVESSLWEDDDEDSSSDEEDNDGKRRRRPATMETQISDGTEGPFSDRMSGSSFSDMPLPANSGLPPVLTNRRRVSSAKTATTTITTASSPVSPDNSVLQGRSPFDDVNAIAGSSQQR